MGGSGLLLFGVVLLWGFGAVPYWVRRREALASAHAQESPAEQLRLLQPRRTSSQERGASSEGLLARRPGEGSGALRGATPEVTAPALRPAGSRTEAATTAGRAGGDQSAPPSHSALASRASVVVAAVALAAVLAPLALSLAGLAPAALAPAGLLALGALVVVQRIRLRRRAVARSMARREAAAARRGVLAPARPRLTMVPQPVPAAPTPHLQPAAVRGGRRVAPASLPHERRIAVGE